MPFAIKKYVFPFSLVQAKLLGDYFDIMGYGANNTFQLIKTSNNLSTECLERKRRRNPNKKKIREFILNAANSILIAIDTGGFNLSIRTLSPNVKVININY
jgi:hypothetical protein